MDVAIYILTRDRPSGLSIQLSHVLKTSLSSASVIISDNSAINKNYRINQRIAATNGVAYIRRRNLLSVFDHIHACARETKYKYIILLHDDDRVSTNIFEEYASIVKRFKKLDAVCGISTINGKTSNRAIDFDNVQNVDMHALIGQYSLYRNPYKSVFPFYLFRTVSLKEALLTYDDFGVYSDFSILFTRIKRYLTSLIFSKKAFRDSLLWKSIV